MEEPSAHTVGTYLGQRLHEVVRVGHVFCVPGDFNMTLLDELQKGDNIKLICCSNELNAGYAADGYARHALSTSPYPELATARSSVPLAGVVVLTYNVGSLGAVNAVAGAYAEDIPLVVISGGLNSNDYGSTSLIHHAYGRQAEGSESLAIFRHITAAAVSIRHPSDAPGLIDQTIMAAISKRKPVYLELAANIITEKVPSPIPMSAPEPPISNQEGLKYTIKAIERHWANARNPVLIAGAKLRGITTRLFFNLAFYLACPVAVMPDARGMFPETHPSFIGVYWGAVSTSKECQEMVENSDLLIYVGPNFNDYSTTGFTTALERHRAISIHPSRVVLPEGECVDIQMSTLLPALSVRLSAKEISPRWERLMSAMHDKPATPPTPTNALSSETIAYHINSLISPHDTVVVEVGIAWFLSQALRIPEGASHEIQMQYSSIGWATPAVFGIALDKGLDSGRAIGIIGDGSFQAVAQELSAMIRYDTNPILIILNNRQYVIESVLHGNGQSYNQLNDWDYAGLLHIMDKENKGLAMKVTTEKELREAIKKAKDHSGLVLIECVIDPSDYPPKLAAWGKRLTPLHNRPLEKNVVASGLSLPLELA